MVVNVTVEYAIQQGKEKEALELVKELNQGGLDHPTDASWRRLWFRGDSPEPEAAGYYREHSRSFSEFNPLSDTPAKIRIYLTAGM